MNQDSTPFSVVILSDFANFSGGASVVALQSALRLAELGHDVTLFTAVGPVAGLLQDKKNLRVICLGQQEIAKDPNRKRAFLQGAWNRPAAKALDQLLATLDPRRTVVHAHLWMKALSPSVFAVAFKRKFKVAVTLHDFFAACPNGGFYDYVKGEVCYRRPLSMSCVTCSCDRRSYSQKLWRCARTWLQTHVARLPMRTAHFIGVSKFSVDILKPFLPSGTPQTVVRNPIDAEDHGPANVAENEPFVFVGRLVPEKGVFLCAEAARKAGVRAVFVGDGELRAELQSKYPEFEITGWQDSAAVQARLRGARALVFPSQWYETLGLVVVEAAANGVPAIVSNGCAASDTVVDGETGLHFAAGSVDNLAEKLSLLNKDSATAARLGRAAYERYWQRPWTREAHVSELLDVYRRIVPANAA